MDDPTTSQESSEETLDYFMTSSDPCCLLPWKWSPRRVRLVRTSCMLLFHLTLGLYVGIMSPATLDLMAHFDCRIDQLSIALTGKSIGIMPGSLLGALLAHRSQRHSDLWLCLLSITAGGINMALPWLTSLVIFGVSLGVQGVLTGAMNVILNTMIMAEWGVKSPTPMNALHLAFTLGILAAPPTTAPFLSKDDNGTTYSTECSGPTVYPSVTYMYTPPTCVREVAHNATSSYLLYVPFTIHGGIAVMAGLLFLTFYCMGWEYQSVIQGSRTASASDGSEPTALARNDKVFKVVMAFSMFVTYFAIVNRDNALAGFSFYIAVKSGIMYKSTAIIFNTVYNGSWALGRLIGTLIGNLVKVHYLVFVGAFGTLLDGILLIFFGLKSNIWFWILNAVFGVFCGPGYASVMAWADRYTPMGGIMVSVVDIGIGTGAFASTYLCGYLLNYYDPVTVYIFAAGSAGLLSLMVVCIQIRCYFRGERVMCTPGITRNVSAQEDHEPLINS